MQDEDEVELLLKKACAAAEMEAKMEIENLKTDKEIERRLVGLQSCSTITAHNFPFVLE